MKRLLIDEILDEAQEEIGAPPVSIGHSTNLVGLPTNFLASCDFNEDPQAVHISGVRELNPQLFEMLGLAKDLEEAGHAFDNYMNAMFGLDPEQRQKERRAAAARRRYRSSYLDLIKGWSFDSNGAEGAVLKGRVESRFGIFPTYHKKMICKISTGAWTTYIEEKMSSRFHNNSIYTQLDLLYEFCQWSLTHFIAADSKHIALYRGINSFEEHQIGRRLDKSTVVMRLNNLASFAYDRDIAGCFGDIILTAQVPITKLCFSTRSCRCMRSVARANISSLVAIIWCMRAPCDAGSFVFRRCRI
jgi:NAD+--dinitrogen-reductase ADP-D-ribosyltransferase